MPKVNIFCRLCKNENQYRADNSTRHIKKIHCDFLFFARCRKEIGPLKKNIKLYMSDNFQLQELYEKFKRKCQGALDVRKFGTCV